MKRKILFIINPISGATNKNNIVERINKLVDTSIYKEIIYTKAAKHAIELANENKSKFDTIVAVGGDGSINEIFRGLVNTNCKLGIIPLGSGNGLARHLNIPLKINKAIELINNGRYKLIDTVEINNEKFVNIAGLGFDAHIAHLFDKYGKRGFLSYAKLTIRELIKYQPIKASINYDNKSINIVKFLIVFANSSQFGNNFYIAPKAFIDDGKLNIVLVDKPAFLESIPFVARAFTKRINSSKRVNTFTTDKITIKCNENIKVHLDGEPYSFGKQIDVKINSKSLRVIC